MGMAFFSQAGTTVHGAYDVLVSMAVLTEFLPFLFVFAAMIAVQGRAVSAEVRRVPGGRPVAILLAGVGLASTLLTIVLSVIPTDDDPHPVWAVVKVLGATAVLVGAGVVVFLVEKHRQRGRAVMP
jgi:amino acid transporter